MMSFRVQCSVAALGQPPALPVWIIHESINMGDESNEPFDWEHLMQKAKVAMGLSGTQCKVEDCTRSDGTRLWQLHPDELDGIVGYVQVETVSPQGRKSLEEIEQELDQMEGTVKSWV